MRMIYQVIALGLIYLSVSTVNAFAADKSLMLYLPFSEGNGDVTRDESQYNHEAKLVNNPKWVDGKVGKALEFTGNNYVIVPIVDDLQLKENFSVLFWVKRDKTQPATWNYMVAAGTLKWAVIFNTDGKVYIWSMSGGGWAQRLITTVPLETEWTYIAALYSDDGMKLYFNGEEKEAGTGAKPPIADDIDGSIMVGARNPGQEFFRGVIDEVAIYNRVVTMDEIKRDMKAVGGAAVNVSDKLATTWGNIKDTL